MFGGVGRWLPVVIPFLIGASIWWVLADRAIRRKTSDPAARRRSLALVGMVAGTAPWIWMILTPTSAPRRVHLDPVSGLADVLTGDPATAVVQIGGNLMVFAAFGLFAPMRWPLGVWAVTGLATVGSVTVETLQWLLDLGRVSATDDVLVNALGAALAAGTARLILRVRTPQPRGTADTRSPS